MPIKDGAGEVLAVAQVVNKLSTASLARSKSFDSAKTTKLELDDESVFTEHDVNVFRAYTAFCGIGLHHAQILWKSQLETQRSQVSLSFTVLLLISYSFKCRANKFLNN